MFNDLIKKTTKIKWFYIIDRGKFKVTADCEEEIIDVYTPCYVGNWKTSDFNTVIDIIEELHKMMEDNSPFDHPVSFFSLKKNWIFRYYDTSAK